MDEKQTFFVLKDSDGIYRPMAFIARADDTGIERKASYATKLQDGESIELVKFVEV
jgi:hypothetical protein